MMDSVLEEDVTLPRTLSGCSGLVPHVPDDLDGINLSAGLGSSVLPNVSEEMVSPTRARNMKDFENQITELKKENFNLKLRIYFLEERMQQEFDGPTEHIYKTNIELKVEVESLKQELQEREQLLIKASKAVESLAEGGGSEVQRVKEEARRKVQQVEEALSARILLLEEDVKATQAELEKAFAGTEMEKALRLNLESKLSEMKKTRERDLEMVLVLEEKDRLIEELKLSLKSKEALIQSLKEEKSQMASPDENVSSGELRGLSAALREEQEREMEAVQVEHQKERDRFEERIQALQEDLQEKEREIATEKKNSLKRDKAIQGLTMALKSKEQEVEELISEIEELSAAFAEAQEAAQTEEFQGSEDDKPAPSGEEPLLDEVYAENHRLRRNIKKVTQELSDLQQERERLEKDLKEAHRERSKGDCTILDLRNEVEKLHNEVNEREKAVENRYKSLLNESHKKLHSQEQAIKRLIGNANEKDLLLQKFNENDLEVIQQNCYLMTTDDLEFKSESLTEKCPSQQSPASTGISEEKPQSDYEELIEVLQKEQDIYTHLVESLQESDSINNLQAELDKIFALRKQLEHDVLSYQNLQKTLEEQISEIRRQEEEPLSFYSDQTSYLSICLEKHNQFQVEHFSKEELKKKVSDLIQLVKELYADNQHLKKTICDHSCVSFQGDGGLGSAGRTKLLASKEDENTIKIGKDDENDFLSDQHLEQSNEILEDRFKGCCKNGYLDCTDSSILDYDGAHKPGCPGDQNLEEGAVLTNLLAPFINEKATLLLESRPDLLKVLCELLLERICLAEQEVSGEHLYGKAEKTLKQIAVQLRGELGQFVQAKSFSKPQELKSPWEAQLLKAGEVSKVELKDASAQTEAVEDNLLGFRHEGTREAWEEKSTRARVSAERQPETLCRMPGQPALPPCLLSGTDRDTKKSRLPVLIKPSRSLGNVYHLPTTQDVVAQLQCQILKLQGELKEFKNHNKQLHQKLNLAEALMEGRPAPDTTLLNDSEIYSSSDLAILPARKKNPEDFLGLTSVATYVSSKSQPSIKASVAGTDQSEDINTSNDTEHLKQKIHNLETELEGYRNFIFQLQKHSQCSEAIITVLCGKEGAQDCSSKPTVSTDEEEMTFSSLHQVRYVKHMKILHPLASEMIDGRMLESLTQQLLEQEYELQKEQNLNMELFSEIHNLQNKFRDLSPSRYNSLVQSQARELSLQRQQIKDSHGICVIYRQHMKTMIKAFKELLQASDVDYCVAEGFQEQLNQCAELLEKLEKLFLIGKSGGVEMSTQNELVERIEEDRPTYQHILPESPEPSASRALSDCEISEKSFSRDQKQDSETEKTSVVVNNFSQDLLMEHIQEIRTLRKRLEESIKTNEKLRKQLEQQGAEADQGPTNICASGSELHNSLTSEIHFLRKQNQALNTMLVKGSRDKQKENEKLRESLSRKTARLEHLQRECAGVKEENERLQREVSGKERHSRQLLAEVCSTRKELSRLQEEVRLRQQLLSQNDKLLQSLRVELKVYEKLDEEHRRLREARVSGEGWKGQEPCSDLHGLLTEIQDLRVQLEGNIETNSALQSRLEEQLARGAEKAEKGALALAVQVLAVPQQSLQLDIPDGDKGLMASDNSFDLFDSIQAVTPKSASETSPFSGNDVDSLSCDSGSSASLPGVSHLVTGSHLWASKDGHHVLGLIEDFEALCMQISQGQGLLAQMHIQTQEAVGPASEELATKGPHSVLLSKFITHVSEAKLILDEASRQLKLLWRVSLPTDGQCGLHCEQIGELKAEITELHKKLSEQEKKLQNTVQLLQLSKHQEKVIFDQLVITHKILRKARGNLELRPGGPHPGTSSPSRPGS
ncbi:CDK5 regulatory subunit-associated protein 2 isoform X2 [Nycticebus coucang]|uniref:CDK5 regulatory subunit-associated protein 2 isoform X2 n=1 Tax=Nycticebus coucang TaxID=9470 RepID=UPI00234CAA64|nr:CDK5 regulatory subunit-associated protein 2 isoform X2 [Nycticebus coucang]